jgi:hypothetical protein
LKLLVGPIRMSHTFRFFSIGFLLPALQVLFLFGASGATQKKGYLIVPPSTDFSQYAKKYPWQPFSELVERLTARKP